MQIGAINAVAVGTLGERRAIKKIDHSKFALLYVMSFAASPLSSI
jgi:hypothetical protein